jgi:hypothetical protein
MASATAGFFPYPYVLIMCFVEPGCFPNFLMEPNLRDVF